MRALIVFESFFGTTAAVADAVATGIARTSLDADVRVVPVARAPRALSDLDLVVVGAPTHLLGISSGASRWLQAQYWGDPVAPLRRRRPHGRPSARRSMREWLTALPDAWGLQAAVFDTRMPGRAAGGAARGVARRLGRRGLRLVAPPEAFVVQGVTGGPADGELERARAWGESLASRTVSRAPQRAPR